jgi:asparagine synthase (glutamine-hydrolysing)
MSAQAGIWNFDGKPIDPVLLDDFSASLKQQGPDDEFCYINRSIALLYRPFYTTALSRTEKQPYHSPGGLIITWDGRLDNRDELLPLLRNDLTSDHSDIAIVAAAFEHWGTGCFQHLVGDWAVSVWNPSEQELFFASDFMAIRHIFYYLKKDRLWWSTALNPLVLHSGDKFDIDDDYISGYFANDPDAHLTPYRGIYQVPPGQFVRVREGRIAVQRFWLFSAKSRIRYKTDAEFEDHFRHIFRQSVRRRLCSDSRVLADLSGGLDSSTIVCMGDEILSREGAETPGLDTISHVDRSEPRGDDWTYLQKIETKRGRAGHHVDIRNSATTPVSLVNPEFSPIPGYLGFLRNASAQRAEIIRNGNYRVTLSGTGGDDFMGGVPDPCAQLADLIMQFSLIKLAKELMAWSIIQRKPWIHILMRSSLELVPRALRQFFIEEAKIAPWIDKGFAKRTRLAVRQFDVEEHFSLLLPSRRSYIAGVLLMSRKMSKGHAPDLLKGEPRYPYLDQNLIEFILSIPASQLLRPGERRSLMRRSLVSVVPSDILARRTKQLFTRGPSVTLDTNWTALESTVESPCSATLGYINRERFLEALKSARNGASVPIVTLLKTISLEFWLRDLFSRNLLDVICRTIPSPLIGSLQAGADV